MCVGQMHGFIKWGTHGWAKTCTIFGQLTIFSGLFFVCFHSFIIPTSIIQIEKSIDDVLGFEPGATGWSAQTKPWSYDNHGLTTQLVQPTWWHVIGWTKISVKFGSFAFLQLLCVVARSKPSTYWGKCTITKPIWELYFKIFNQTKSKTEPNNLMLVWSNKISILAKQISARKMHWKLSSFYSHVSWFNQNKVRSRPYLPETWMECRVLNLYTDALLFRSN